MHCDYSTCVSDCQYCPSAAATCWWSHVAPCWYFSIKHVAEIRLARPPGDVQPDAAWLYSLHYVVGNVVGRRPCDRCPTPSPTACCPATGACHRATARVLTMLPVLLVAMHHTLLATSSPPVAWRQHASDRWMIVAYFVNAIRWSSDPQSSLSPRRNHAVTKTLLQLLLRKDCYSHPLMGVREKRDLSVERRFCHERTSDTGMKLLDTWSETNAWAERQVMKHSLNSEHTRRIEQKVDVG